MVSVWHESVYFVPQNKIVSSKLKVHLSLLLILFGTFEYMHIFQVLECTRRHNPYSHRVINLDRNKGQKFVTTAKYDFNIP